MDGSAVSGNVVLLLDNYSEMSRLLHSSLLQVNEEILAIVLVEDYFLPENVLSIYDLIIGNYKNNTIRKSGRPKFFNEIPAPDSWTFQAGDKKEGSITYQQVKKGKICYVNGLRRGIVQDVEWYDRAGVTRFCDHYNRHGDICARTVYDPAGTAVSKSWLSLDGQEIVMENYVTHDIILNDENVIEIFHSKEDLMFYFLKKFGFHKYRIFINSLATSFSLANRLDSPDKADILFWQEIAENEIPWNMRVILDGGINYYSKIIVQRRSAYNRLTELGLAESKVQKLGFIHSFEKENRHQPDALICTNSDQVEHCEALIKALPQMHFHIAALTWMSPALFALEQYDNVSLHPGAEPSVMAELFMKCDYYFDINYFNEIVSAVYRAFLHNQLIFAFQETVHNRDYVADLHTYPISEFDNMVLKIQEIMADKTVMMQHLEEQHKWALAGDKDTYQDVLGI